MAATFDELLKYFDKYKIGENQAPSLLIPGGQRYPIDLREQLQYNKQLVLVVHEFKRKEPGDVVGMVRNQIMENLRITELVIVQPYDDLAEIEAVLDGFSNYYGEALDKEKIIRRVKKYHNEETYFYLFVAVLELPFFKI